MQALHYRELIYLIKEEENPKGCPLVYSEYRVSVQFVVHSVQLDVYSEQIVVCGAPFIVENAEFVVSSIELAVYSVHYTCNFQVTVQSLELKCSVYSV